MFGFDPLQQYLIELDRGRIQALTVCWDSRPASVGGQRWFHLHDEPIPHDDPLHWTGQYQNWNFMCAECHSTNLQRGFDVAANRYDTTWSEIDVSCEACHGPGSAHVTWAQSGATDENRGLAVKLSRSGTWQFPAGESIAKLSSRDEPDLQVDTCARCHARRTPVHASFASLMVRTKYTVIKLHGLN